MHTLEAISTSSLECNAGSLLVTCRRRRVPPIASPKYKLTNTVYLEVQLPAQAFALGLGPGLSDHQKQRQWSALWRKKTLKHFRPGLRGHCDADMGVGARRPAAKVGQRSAKYNTMHDCQLA